MKIFLIVSGLVFWLSVYSQEKINNSVVKSEYSYQYALIEASRQKMIGNVNEAISLYLSCISSNPESGVAYYELGTVYSAMGENQKAEEKLAVAYKLDTKNYWYGIAYSELLKQNKNNSKSLKILKKVRKLNQNNRLTIDFKIAEILTEDKKYHKALNFLDKIERENGVSELISFKKVEIYKTLKNYVKAENVLTDLISKAPDVSEYQILMAELFSEIGDSIRALKAYESAFKIDSSNIYAVTNLADMYSSFGDNEKAYYYLNQAFQNKKIPLNSKIQTMIYINKDRDLIKKNKKQIELMIISLMVEYPDNFDVKTVAYDFYNGLEEHEKALAIIKNILITKKDDYIIWQQALYNASMLENFDEIIEIGEEALKYFPNKNELYLFVGMAEFQKENFEEAYNTLYQPFSSLKDDDKIKIQYLLFLSESAYKTNRKKQAYSFYDMLIELDPANDFTKNNYSYYLALDSIDLLKAKELSYSTINNSPENSTFIDTYAWILYQLGDFTTAKYYSEKAMVINGELDPDIIFHYAEILYSLNEYASSEKYYKLAEERGYDKQIVEKRLHKIPGTN
jgi:tetratricopeptide (TPR) repeat protein